MNERQKFNEEKEVKWESTKINRLFIELNKDLTDPNIIAVGDLEEDIGASGRELLECVGCPLNILDELENHFKQADMNLRINVECYQVFQFIYNCIKTRRNQLKQLVLDFLEELKTFQTFEALTIGVELAGTIILGLIGFYKYTISWDEHSGEEIRTYTFGKDQWGDIQDWDIFYDNMYVDFMIDVADLFAGLGKNTEARSYFYNAFYKLTKWNDETTLLITFLDDSLIEQTKEKIDFFLWGPPEVGGASLWLDLKDKINLKKLFCSDPFWLMENWRDNEKLGAIIEVIHQISVPLNQQDEVWYNKAKEVVRHLAYRDIFPDGISLKKREQILPLAQQTISDIIGSSYNKIIPWLFRYFCEYDL